MSDQNAQAAQPLILGQLSAEEQQVLSALRQRTDQAIYSMGGLAAQQHRIMADIQQMERQGRGVLNQAGKRLNIPEGTPWSVTNEGFAIQTAPAGPVEVPTPAEDDLGTPKA